MDINISLLLILISVVMFASSFYYNGNGQLGYKGLLFLISSKNKQKIYVMTNRITSVLILFGSLLYIFLFGVLGNSLAIRLAFIIYLFLSMGLSDVITFFYTKK